VASSDGAVLDGLQQAVDRLAAKLGRSVAIDDAQGRLVVSSGHFGEEDELRVFAIVNRYSDPRVLAHFRAHGIYGWTEPGRVPANEELRFKARVACPIRDHGILFGHLFLIDEDLSDPDVDEAMAATVRIGQLMYRRLTQHQEAERRTSELVRDLVSSDGAAQARALDRVTGEQLVVATDPVAALVVTAPDARAPEDAEESGTWQTDLQVAVERATRERLMALSIARVQPGEATVLLFGRASASVSEVASQAVSRMEAAGHAAVAGFGPSASGAAAAAASYAEARLAARAAALLGELGPVVGPEDLGVHRWLLRLPDDELRESRYPAELRRLVAADTNDNLVATLEAYLDCAGDAGATAAVLHVHRSTLYYRLGRIEQLAEVDLRDGRQRLLLHLGLRLKHLVEAR